MAAMILPCLILLFSDITSAAAPVFSQAVLVGNLSTNLVTEASGLAASRRHPGILYTHNDRGDSARFYAINASDASLVAVFNVPAAHHHDWEDIAVGPCPYPDTDSCIYIGDIGSGGSQAALNIYRVKEPARLTNQNLTLDSWLYFDWSAGEGQTIMVDQIADVYVVTDVTGGRAKMYLLPFDAWGQHSRTYVHSTSSVHVPLHTTHHDPRSGDISPNGKDILLKAVEHVYYFHAEDGDYFNAMLTQQPIELPYHREYLGEAICWDHTGNTYYTLSEGKNAPLYSYSRTTATGSPIVG